MRIKKALTSSTVAIQRRLVACGHCTAHGVVPFARLPAETTSGVPPPFPTTLSSGGPRGRGRKGLRHVGWAGAGNHQGTHPRSHLSSPRFPRTPFSLPLQAHPKGPLRGHRRCGTSRRTAGEERQQVPGKSLTLPWTFCPEGRVVVPSLVAGSIRGRRRAVALPVSGPLRGAKRGLSDCFSPQVEVAPITDSKLCRADHRGQVSAFAQNRTYS